MVKRLFLAALFSTLLTAYLPASDGHDTANAYDQAIESGKQLLPENYIGSLIELNKAVTRPKWHNTEEINHPKADKAILYKILISQAMSESDLKQLFQALEHRKDVVFVLRGLLLTEQKINDVSKRIIAMIRETGAQVNVQLDPTPFEQVQAEYAPQILAYQGNKLLISASGIANPNYIAEQIAQGKEGNLGNFGSTVKISERNLTEILKERASKLNGQKLANEAKNRYWDNVEFLDLPDAQNTQARTFKPVLTINEDIITPDGKIVAFQGQRVNTLDLMPFTQRLVFFNATDPAQFEFVKNLPPSVLRTKLITTHFDRKLKWDAVNTVERKLKSPIYLLNSDLINAFNLQVIPSVVIADNDKNHFLITEYKMERH